MDDRQQPIAGRLAQLQQRIAAACQRCGRSPLEITLVGASKAQPVGHLRDAFAAGLRAFGENRVQEGLRKAAELSEEIDWHLLGPLQSNKVRSSLQLFRTFHGIDRRKIAELLDHEASRAGLQIQGFLEVNLAGEESKHGYSIAELRKVAPQLLALESLSIVGLMAIPPWSEDPEISRAYFRQLRELRDDLRSLSERPFPGQLSMGMSGDFEIAIEEGATHVRIGTALFGERRL